MRRKASSGRSLHESVVGLAVTVLVLMVDSYHGFMGDDGSEASATAAFSTEPWILHDVSSTIFLRLFEEPTTWLEAEQICQAHFGHLVRDGSGNEATVHDFLSSIERTRSGPPDADDAFDGVHEEEETNGDRQRRQQQQQHRRSSRSRRAASEVWIGLYQSSTAERFHWVDDVTSPLSTLGSSIEVFATNQNQNLGMCVSMDPRRGYRWNTRRCTGPDKARFICQLPVPAWLSQGKCNISAWSDLHSTRGRRVGARDEDEDGDVPSRMSLEAVQYFPHNDSAQIRFSCPLPAPEGGAALFSKDDILHSRTVTCTFAEEQAKKSGATDLSDLCTGSAGGDDELTEGLQDSPGIEVVSVDANSTIHDYVEEEGYWAANEIGEAQNVIAMPDDAERFSVSSSSSSSFPRFEDHSAMNLEAGGIREKRDAAAVEGDLASSSRQRQAFVQAQWASAGVSSAAKKKNGAKNVQPPPPSTTSPARETD